MSMNLIMCSGKAPFKVVAAGSLCRDWYSLIFLVGVLTGVFIDHRRLLVWSGGGVLRGRLAGSGNKVAITELGDI